MSTKHVRDTADLVRFKCALKITCDGCANARTLDGLPNLPKLTRLEVGRCRNLESLGSLAEVCPNLETLLVSASGRIRIDEAKRVASRLPHLLHLVAADKLLIDPNAT